MEVVVLSREMFADSTYMPLFDRDAIISIQAPGETHPRPNVYGLRRLDIDFEDVTEELLGYRMLLRPIDKGQAEIIVNFAEEILPWTDRLIIHCAAGVSRSPGVAVGLARYFDIGSTENELRDKHPHFNITVAKRIWEVCEERGLEPRT